MPDLAFEEAARAEGFAPVCGIDEAGRGPWAGPVVAAAVVIAPGALDPELQSRLDDSKKLKPVARAALFSLLESCPGVAIGLGAADVGEIDTLNILEATLLAMRRAVAALAEPPALALVDGNRPPDLVCPVRCIVGGDAKSLSVAAASISAKVTRDRLMADLARDFPGYGWERNAGYGTAEHADAIRRLGITPEHRRSFAPIRKMLSPGTP